MKTRSVVNFLLAAAAVVATDSLLLNTEACAADAKWRGLFNGRDLSGWKISDNGMWRVEDGAIVANGPRSHLFTEEEFTDFEFKAEVKTTSGSNSGIYVHTKFQETGWPMQGHEIQVNVSHGDPVKSGSIYNVVKLYNTPAVENEWNNYHIIVRGNTIVVNINGETVIDYWEPEGVEGTRRLSAGSIALQAHDPLSVTYYRNLRVKSLAD